MICRAVKACSHGQKGAVPRAQGQILDQTGVAQRIGDFGLVDHLGQFARPQHRHGVDHHRPRLGRRQPASHHGRIVGRPDQHPVSRPDPIVFGQHMGDAVGPVGKLLVGSTAAIADQRNIVAKALCDHAVGQFNADIQPVGIVEPGQVQVRPGLQGWQPVARETVGMAGGTKHVVYSRSLPTLSLRAPPGNAAPVNPV